MYIVHVFIHVKPESIDAFKAASLDNAINSRREPGVARFDLIQEADDPTRFVLLEVYRTKNDTDLHKQTSHYNRWCKTVEPLLLEPRKRIVYANINPTDEGWG